MRPHLPAMVIAVLVVPLLLAGCDDTPSGQEPAMTAPSSITVTSTAFRDGEAIPARYSCDGDNVSPPLTWDGLPSDAAAVALVVDDPDAPRGTFYHWLVVDLPASTTSLAQGKAPAGAVQAKNSAGKASYFGPCPPSGTHHYRFTVYALSKPTGLANGAALDKALKAIDAVSVAQGRLTGLYSR